MKVSSDEAAVRIACVQMEPVVGRTDDNVTRSVELVERAAAPGARLVVLPELCNTGYVFESRPEAFRLAEEIPHGPTCRVWMDTARRHGLHLVAGIAERDGQALYNAAVVIGPAGHVGTYRKMHLWAAENLFFEPGNLGVLIGQSVIVSYTGWPIAGPAGPDREEIIYADANLADARRKRSWNEYNQVLRDRRIDVYDETLGAKVTRNWY